MRSGRGTMRTGWCKNPYDEGGNDVYTGRKGKMSTVLRWDFAAQLALFASVAFVAAVAVVTATFASASPALANTVALAFRASSASFSSSRCLMRSRQWPGVAPARIGRVVGGSSSSSSSSSSGGGGGGGGKLFERRGGGRGGAEDDDFFLDGYDDGDGINDYYDDERDGFDSDRRRRRYRRRRPTDDGQDDLGTIDSGTGMGVPSPFGMRSGLRLPDSVSKALLAGIFVLGIGTGVTIESQINTSPKDLASRDAIDRNAPNPTLCAQYGASAMAFDQRVFVSFNPFNVYVAQADVKPACVLRQSNVVQVLRDRKLINDDEVRACKTHVNTWAFVGDLDNMPQLSCVYQSDDAQNEFLSNPKLGIGEDVYDDDRAAVEQRKRSTGKLIKNSMTEAQVKKMAGEYDGSLGS